MNKMVSHKKIFTVILAIITACFSCTLKTTTEEQICQNSTNIYPISICYNQNIINIKALQPQLMEKDLIKLLAFPVIDTKKLNRTNPVYINYIFKNPQEYPVKRIESSVDEILNTQDLYLKNENYRNACSYILRNFDQDEIEIYNTYFKGRAEYSNSKGIIPKVRTDISYIQFFNACYYNQYGLEDKDFSRITMFMLLHLAGYIKLNKETPDTLAYKYAEHLINLLSFVDPDLDAEYLFKDYMKETREMHSPQQE